MLKCLWGLILHETNRALSVRVAQRAASEAILLASSFSLKGKFSYSGVVPLVDLSVDAHAGA